jgi:hypothetical protein
VRDRDRPSADAEAGGPDAARAPDRPRPNGRDAAAADRAAAGAPPQDDGPAAHPVGVYIDATGERLAEPACWDDAHRLAHDLARERPDLAPLAVEDRQHRTTRFVHGGARCELVVWSAFSRQPVCDMSARGPRVADEAPPARPPAAGERPGDGPQAHESGPRRAPA